MAVARAPPKFITGDYGPVGLRAVCGEQKFRRL